MEGRGEVWFYLYKPTNLTMSRRYDFQDILDRFAATQNQRFRELSDAIARRILELLGGGTVPNDPPGAPSNLTASTDQEFRVVLDWDSVTGATGYNVYRAPLGSSQFSLLSQASQSDYTDSGLPADTSYRYYVTAYNSSGESGPSTTEVGTTADGAAPPLPDVPANFQVLSNEDTVTLGWDAFTGGTISCRIERSADQATWTQVANTGNVTFNDASVTIGATFYYRAFGISATGISSVATPTLTVTVVDGDTEAPPVPVLTSTTLANKSVLVEWAGVVAADLAGYEVGYGTAPGIYTSTTDLIPGTSVSVGGLTNFTNYFFAVRSVDTSLNENKSAWSNEQSKTPVNNIDPVLLVDPEPPTALTVSSPERDEIRVGFTPGVTLSPRRHRLYARVKPGQLVNGAAPTEAWTQIDQVPNPGTVLGEDATIFAGIYSWFQNPVIWQFYATCVDTYSQESVPSEIVESAVDGSSWNQGPGSGPISGGNFNGDSLTSTHRVPGATFDYVIDVSDPTTYSGDAVERAAAIFNNRRNLATSNPDYIQLSTTDKAAIAVLLPSETVNRRLEINTGAAGNEEIEVANFDFGGDPGFVSLVDLHLVGPWDASNTLMVDAQLAMRDDPLNFTLGYKRTFKDADNKSKFGDGAGNNIVVGDVTRDNAKLELWFWNWDVEVSGGSGVLVGSNADQGSDFNSHDFWVGFGLCRFHQDAILPNNVRIGSHAIDARYAKVAMGGTYIDMPWQDGSAVRCLSPLRGDFELINCRVRRSGGSAFEYYTRNSRDAGLPEGTDPGTLSIVGFRHWDETAGLDDGIGRASSEGTYVFDFGGLEQSITISDAHIIQENPTNFRGLGQWPPSDPYDWRVYTAAVRMSHSAIRLYDRAGSRARSDGYKHGDLTISNSLFYSKYPRNPVLDVGTAKTVTFNDVGAWTGETIEMFSVDSVGAAVSLGNSTLIGYGYNGSSEKPPMAPTAIGPLTATDLNTAAQETELTATYGINASFIAAADAGIDFAGLVPGHFPVTDPHSFVSLTGPGQTYTQPVGLSPTWPAPQTIDAPAIYLARNTREENKNLRLPVLRQLRTGRVTANIPWLGGYVVNWSEAEGGTPNTNLYPGDPNYFYDVTNDISFWPGKGKPGGSGYYPANMDPSNVEFNSNGLEVVFKDMIDDLTVHDGTSMSNMYKRGVTNPPLGSETAPEPAGYVPPDGKIVVRNCALEAGLDEDVTWGFRYYNTPRMEFIDCDFSDIKDEHSVYTDTPHDFYAKSCTASDIGSQVLQVQSRAYNGGKPTDNVPVTYSMHCVVDDFHMVDVTGAHNYGTRPSYSLTLGNRGTSEFPGRAKIMNTSWVCGGDPSSQAGIASNTGTNNGRSFGPLVVSIEQGMQTLLDFDNSTRANTGTMMEWVWLKNVLVHGHQMVRNAIKIMSTDTIILEDVALINDSSGGDTSWFRQPLHIDTDNDAIEADPRLGSRKLILRNVYCNGAGSPTDMAGNTAAKVSHGYSRWNDDPNRLSLDIHTPGIQVEYDIRPDGSSTPIYSGPYRAYTDIEGNTLDMTTRFD